MDRTNISLNPTDLEALVRRVVREELARLVRSHRPTGDDPRYEGPLDETGDAALVIEALEVLEAYGDDPRNWLDWREVRDELQRAEAAGELPD